MTKFITLHWKNGGEELHVNVENICLIRTEDASGSTIDLKVGGSIRVSESASSVMELIVG